MKQLFQSYHPLVKIFTFLLVLLLPLYTHTIYISLMIALGLIYLKRTAYIEEIYWDSIKKRMYFVSCISFFVGVVIAYIYKVQPKILFQFDLKYIYWGLFASFYSTSCWLYGKILMYTTTLYEISYAISELCHFNYQQMMSFYHFLLSFVSFKETYKEAIQNGTILPGIKGIWKTRELLVEKRKRKQKMYILRGIDKNTSLPKKKYTFEISQMWICFLWMIVVVIEKVIG